MYFEKYPWFKFFAAATARQQLRQEYQKAKQTNRDYK